MVRICLPREFALCRPAALTRNGSGGWKLGQRSKLRRAAGRAPRFLVAFAHVRDLLVRAKHLFIVARVGISSNLLDDQLKFRRCQLTVPTLDGAAFTTLAYGPSQPQY
jgi:hypothetical protein